MWAWKGLKRWKLCAVVLLLAFVICFLRIPVEGASGSARNLLLRARLTATWADPSHGNWWASFTPNVSCWVAIGWLASSPSLIVSCTTWKAPLQISYHLVMQYNKASVVGDGHSAQALGGTGKLEEKAACWDPLCKWQSRPQPSMEALRIRAWDPRGCTKQQVWSTHCDALCLVLCMPNGWLLIWWLNDDDWWWRPTCRILTLSVGCWEMLLPLYHFSRVCTGCSAMSVKEDELRLLLLLILFKVIWRSERAWIDT